MNRFAGIGTRNGHRLTLDHLRKLVRTTETYSHTSEIFFFSEEGIPTREQLDAGGNTVQSVYVSETPYAD